MTDRTCSRDVTLSYDRPVFLKFHATACSDVNYLEHVELQINVEYPVRGDLEIYLTSPAGKASRDAAAESRD